MPTFEGLQPPAVSGAGLLERRIGNLEQLIGILERRYQGFDSSFDPTHYTFNPSATGWDPGTTPVQIEFTLPAPGMYVALYAEVEAMARNAGGFVKFFNEDIGISSNWWVSDGPQLAIRTRDMAGTEPSTAGSWRKFCNTGGGTALDGALHPSCGLWIFKAPATEQSGSFQLLHRSVGDDSSGLASNVRNRYLWGTVL